MEQIDIQTILTKLADIEHAIPFNQVLGLKLTEFDAKHVVMEMAMKPELVGNFMHQILHGGVIASALDTVGGAIAMGHAIYKLIPSTPIPKLAQLIGKCSTVDMHIHFLRPGRGKIFYAKAKIIKAGKLLTFTHMELRNDEESLLATANGTYLMNYGA